MRASEAKLRAGVREMPPVAGQVSWRLFRDSGRLFRVYLLLYMWFLSDLGMFISSRGSFCVVIHVGFKVYIIMKSLKPALIAVKSCESEKEGHRNPR